MMGGREDTLRSNFVELRLRPATNPLAVSEFSAGPGRTEELAPHVSHTFDAIEFVGERSSWLDEVQTPHIMKGTRDAERE